MFKLLKGLVSFLPPHYQQALKKLFFPIKIRLGKFKSEEVEYAKLDKWVSKGDLVIDVGANIGTYSYRLSNLVGRNGRVFSFEPIRDTFDLLVSNCAYCKYDNVSFFNVAVSDTSDVVGMSVPKSTETGLSDYYRASITSNAPSSFVYAINLNSINIPQKVKLVKIDAEGHELEILKGMNMILEKDHPVLILEDNNAGVDEYLEKLDYKSQKFAGSWNVVYSAN